MSENIDVDCTPVRKVSISGKVQCACRELACYFVEVITVSGNSYELRCEFNLPKVESAGVVSNLTIEYCADNSQRSTERLNTDR